MATPTARGSSWAREEPEPLQRQPRVAMLWASQVQHLAFLTAIAGQYESFKCHFIQRIQKITKVNFLFDLCSFVCFGPHLQHEEVPRPGIEPGPQHWQRQILNLLSHTGTPVWSVFKRTDHNHKWMSTLCIKIRLSMYNSNISSKINEILLNLFFLFF